MSDRSEVISRDNMVGSVLALVFLLQLVFGALLENNRRLERSSHTAWIATFVLTGPFGLLRYWILHVWPTPRTKRVRKSPRPFGRDAANA